jgi:hypothetical protein
MKMALLVCNSYFKERVLQILKDSDIDYYTSWDDVTGKGHGTEPHLGTRPFNATNAVTMVAFERDEPLETLVGAVKAANEQIRRPADRIRLFQLPLERMV